MVSLERRIEALEARLTAIQTDQPNLPKRCLSEEELLETLLVLDNLRMLEKALRCNGAEEETIELAKRLVRDQIHQPTYA